MSAAPRRAVLEMRPACLQHLAEVRDYVGGACRELGGDEALCDAMVLAADEICTNVLLHGYRSAAAGGPLRVAVRREGEMIVLMVADEAPPFDPRQTPAPDLDAELPDRPIGGLGWHLVRQVVDEVHWESQAAGGNVVTLARRVAPA